MEERDGREGRGKRNRKGTEIPKRTTPECKRDTNCRGRERGTEERDGREGRDKTDQVEIAFVIST
jgi:hypothetical protein